ncbi:MAG: hypothetical protein GY856_55485 [bacterium]|nr:hypothetical protein [bacterium]
MKSSGFTISCLFVVLVLFPFQQSGGAATNPRVEASSPEKALHEELQRVERALQGLLERIERPAAGAREPEARLQREVVRVRTHLRFLEARIHGLDSSEANLLLGKLHPLENLVRNLALAVEQCRAQPARLMESSAGYRPVGAPATRPPGKEGAPPNDDCRNALAIGNGTFAGDTSAATNDGRASCGLSDSAPDVWLSYSFPAAGHVFVNTLGSSFDTVLSVHTACPGTGANELTCNDNARGTQSAVDFDVSAGEEYLIRVSGFANASGPFTLDVGAGGAISGTVTDAATGDPIPFIVLDVWNENGYYVNTGSSAPTGEYTVEGLATGTYFVSVGNSFNYLAEVYDDLPCPGDNCDPTSGAPVEVSLNSITTGIDFALDLGGTISGTVTDAAAGGPIPAIAVRIWDSGGSSAGAGYTDSSGNYRAGGLAAGNYYAISDSPGYRDELYDDLPCPAGGAGGCHPTTGKPIAVRIDSTTSDIDFALDRLGAISGTVTDAVTGDPIPFIDVEIRDAGGFSAGSAQSDSSGNYTVGGLGAGTYFATTSNYSEYVDELYDNLPCLWGAYDGCDPTTGTPIEVDLNSTAEGVDFALDRFGAISGTVTHSTTGERVEEIELAVWDASGSWIRWFFAGSLGDYELTGLVPGTYFVTALSDLYAGELYEDLPCPGGRYDLGCDPTTGTPIQVSANATTEGVDFALDRLGVISGTVRDAVTGEPLWGLNIHVRIRDANGSSAGSGWPDRSGYYTVEGLIPGTYFATADYVGYLRELYDELPCPCDPTTGTPIEVSLNSTTEGIDFTLVHPGAISGTVTEAATGDPVPGIDLEIWDAGGSSAGAMNTDSSGDYTVEGLAAGTYFATTNGDNYLDELYDDLPCQDGAFVGCDPTTGTPIEVGLDSTTSGIDFALDRLGAVTGTVTYAATGEPLRSIYVWIWNASGLAVASDSTDSSGNYTVGSLSAGTYFATTEDRYEEEYLCALYDELSCREEGFPFDPTRGTPIEVSVNSTARVDFALDRRGAVSGTVTDAVTDEPITGIDIAIWKADWKGSRSGYTDSSGNYTVTGLPAGTYFAIARSPDQYLHELYDDFPCPTQRFGGCDPTTGTPIAVTLNSTTSGIDFALDRGGMIAGTVSNAVTGAPIQSIQLEIWNPAGLRVQSEYTDSVGRYTFPRLYPGSYFARTRTYSQYHDELYDDLRCPEGADDCDPTGGTPITVSRDSITPGIDFALFPFLLVTCQATSTALCLNGQRFRVEIDWRDLEGNTGSGEVVPFGSDDSGLFWFFEPDNWEMLVKVLDGCVLNDHFWVFSAAVTNVEYTLRVTDTLTGTTKSYFNPIGDAAAAITDTGALATCSGRPATTAENLLRPASPFVIAAARSTELHLNGGRFKVEVEWLNFQDDTGAGQVVPFGSDDSGLFWFFDDDNWEMLVKVLDGCVVNDHFWVFSAAVTNVEYTLRVTDTETGIIKTYFNPLGNAAPAVTDTGAFAPCP